MTDLYKRVVIKHNNGDGFEIVEFEPVNGRGTLCMGDLIILNKYMTEGSTMEIIETSEKLEAGVNVREHETPVVSSTPAHFVDDDIPFNDSEV